MNKRLSLLERLQKPFRLSIIYGCNEGDPQYFYPSITLESVLSKVREHLEPLVDQMELQERLKEIEEETEEKYDFEEDGVIFLIHKLEAKEIYKSKGKIRKKNTHL